MPRVNMSAVADYFERFQEGDAAVPPNGALPPLAKVLDGAAQRVVTEFMQVVRLSPEYQAGIQLLRSQPRTAGQFSQDKILLEDLSSFEQMVIVSDWLAATQIQQNHTFFLSAKDDYIPVQVKKFRNIPANMMHVCFGSTTGSHKAPKYTDWTRSDPREDDGQKIFMAPLEALEIVRQPVFSAATFIKGNAFERDRIDSQWRYGSEYACVEDKGQSKRGQPKITAKKERSAGLNAAALANELSDPSDPRAEETDICREVHFEDYTDEDYRDDLDISVSSGDLIKAAKTAIVGQNTADITRLMENLFIAELEVPRTSLLCNHVAQKLITNDRGR